MSPSHLSVIGGEIYFEGWGDNGAGSYVNALWKTDGTMLGTSFIKEVYIQSNIMSMGGLLYFSGSDPIDGSELWRSDGTAAGTYRVTSIISGANNGSLFTHVVSTGIELFFIASDGLHGKELWVSDGTAVGTSMV